jgi:hypothetical protein
MLRRLPSMPQLPGCASQHLSLISSKLAQWLEQEDIIRELGDGRQIVRNDVGGKRLIVVHQTFCMRQSGLSVYQVWF